MTQSFDTAFAFTIKQEGGFVLSTLPTEKSETYAGIYRYANADWEGWVQIDAGDRISAPLQNMVKNFYFQKFWVPMNLEQLPQPLATLAFDFGLNSGASTAIKKLQHLLMVAEDGDLGARSIDAARSMPADKLNMRYLAARLDLFNDLKSFSAFGKGWTQRIVDLLNFAAK